MKPKISFHINRANVKEIENHLKRVDKHFIPPLSKTVNIVAYATKIANLADTVEAWNNESIVGLIAVYLNEKNFGFITNVSVEKEFSGIGEKLLFMTVEHAKNSPINLINLEVSSKNYQAISLYEKTGFSCETISPSDQTIMMTYKIVRNN